MRKVVSTGLIVLMGFAAAPASRLGAAQAAGTITGTARGRRLEGLPNVRIQIRSISGGAVVGSGTTGGDGTFSVPSLPPGEYVAEVIDAAGKVQGVSAPISLVAGGTSSTSVVAIGLGNSLAASSGGFHLFGMGPATSLTVLGAAAAASVTAVVSTRPDASPSR